MKLTRSKLVALITGFISILICIIYLTIITVFDFRNFLNDQLTNLLTNLPPKIGAIFFVIDNY